MADETKQEETAPSEDAPSEDAPSEEAPNEAASNEAASDEAAQDDEQTKAAAEDETAAEEAATETETATETLTLPTPQAETQEGRSFRKERVGTVVSNKMDKTIVVTIERQKKHAMYSKYLTRTSRLMVHDENNDAGEGDTVLVMETRPLSKHKRWRLLEVLERAK